MLKKDQKIFIDAKRTLEDIERFEKVREFKKEEDESRVEYVKRYRREVREALLNQLVPKRRCPTCLRVKTKSRQWVIIEGREYADLVGRKE